MCSLARSYNVHICNLKSILLFKMNIMFDNMDNFFAHSYKYTIINTKNHRLSFTSCQFLLDK